DRLLRSLLKDREKDLGQEIIDDQDENAGGDDGACGRDADSLGAARCLETVVAGDERDNAAEYEWLGETLDEIVGDVVEGESAGEQLLEYRLPIEGGRLAEVKLGDDVAPQDADEVIDHGENGDHDQRRQNSRGHQLFDRVGAQGIE